MRPGQKARRTRRVVAFAYHKLPKTTRPTAHLRRGLWSSALHPQMAQTVYPCPTMWFSIDSCATGERGPLQSHRRIQISPNVSINAQWRAVTAQNGSQYILAHKESLISHMFPWFGLTKLPSHVYIQGKWLSTSASVIPDLRWRGAIDPVRLERKWTN